MNATLKRSILRSVPILFLLVPNSQAEEGDFKEVKEPEKQEEIVQEEKAKLPKDTVILPQAEYPVRNIGKGDPRFAALHREVAASYRGLTLDSLYSRLLAGETFKIERPDKPVVCKGCNGFGRIPDKGSSYRTKDGKVECPACKGVGKLDSVRVILIKW